MACASPAVDGLLECPVCMEIMVEPKQLPCGHSLCNGCMDRLTLAAGVHLAVSCVGSDVECPTCRKHSQVPHGGFATNFPLAALIAHHMTEQEKKCHKCVMCDKLSALDDTIMCHDCGDICLCFRCAFLSGDQDGHERKGLQHHMENQAKQLQQWKDEKLPILKSLQNQMDNQAKQLQLWKNQNPILKSLTIPSLDIIDKCKVLLDQHQARQQRIWQKGNDFESKLCHSIESREKELTANNGYKFDIASLGEQLQSIEDQHKLSVTNGHELADAFSKMLVSGDFSHVVQIDARAGILLTNGRLFDFYSPSANTTRRIEQIQMGKRLGFMIQVLSDGKVMVAGGVNPKTVYQSTSQSIPTQIIDLVSKHVTQSPPMTTGRCYAASAMIGEQMFVCGGMDLERKILSSCEVYRDGQWLPIAKMQVPRLGHAVVALDGLLYAIGGHNGAGGQLHSVECYSPDTDTWQALSPLNEPRVDLSAAAFKGCIYAAGGRGLGSLNSCGRYSPNLSQWETVAPMNKGRQFFSLVPFGDKLYALGGDGEMTVESYDAEKNQWRVEDITLKLGLKAVVVDYFPN